MGETQQQSDQEFTEPSQVEILNKLKGNTSIDIQGQRIPIAAPLINKTVDFFKERVLVFFEKEHLSQELAEVLFKIQLVIFLIDSHYESNWEYDEMQLLPLWDEIKSLMLKLGINEGDIENFLKDIHEYEKSEQNIRQGQTPDSFEVRDYYFLKSCDVRLQRHLAKFVQAGEICKSTLEQIDYDILGEILDDIDDLQEDEAEGVYNGNRLLFSLKKNKTLTLEEYKNFVNALKAKYGDSDNSGIKTLSENVLEKLERS
jgi:hypothetical protein